MALILVLGVILASIIVAVGCSKRVTGSQKENQKPVAYFVNIPPDGSTSSRNPLVYWVGTDPDGLVRFFRYVVVKRSTMDSVSVGITPADYAAQRLSNLDRAGWELNGGIYLKVDDSLPNTQTQATINMSADLSDPVNTFVPQYVFLQAIDDHGMFSDMAYRLLKRNDNPPTTSISFLSYDESASPFINSPTSGGLITGVRFRIDATDPDYPVNPPPFRYQWKLLGPYTYDTITGGEYKQMINMVLDTVFVSNDAKVYKFGDGRYIVFYCDSVDTAGGHDSIISVPCDTLYIDTITRNNLYGRIDYIVNIDDPTFRASDLYRPVDSSLGWVSSAYDTVFNVYRNFPSEATVQRRFLLWARSQDDAFVSDLTPAYAPCGVIEPKYERDVLLVDFSNPVPSSRYTAPYFSVAYAQDTSYQFWKRALHTWNSNMVFDTMDYKRLQGQSNNGAIDLALFLQHKVAIMFSDNALNAGWYGPTGALSSAGAKTFKAVDAGVNVWICMRAPLGGAPQTRPTFLRPDAAYMVYFGVDSVRFTGWLAYVGVNEEPSTQRIEDFIGAYTLREGWPSLPVDSANLHGRYRWGAPDDYDGRLVYMDSLHALPEVGWAARRNGTEALYLYHSLYGPIHPLGQSFSYDGAPVAHRTETNYFRTVFTAFTPLSIQNDSAQIFVDSIMNWLFDGEVPAPPTVAQDRYPNAAVRLSASEVRRFDAEHTEQQLLEMAKKAKLSSGNK